MISNVQKIKEFATRSKALTSKAVENCKSGMVTTDEEAMWLWENEIALINELDGGRDTSHLDNYRSTLVAIESRLPNFPGLSIKRHL